MLLYLRIKSKIIKNHEHIKTIGEILIMLVMIQVIIGCFGKAFNSSVLLNFVGLPFLFCVGILTTIIIFYHMTISDLNKKVLLINIKVENENINKLIDEIIKYAKKKNSFQIKNWTIYDEIGVYNDETINEPIVTSCWTYTDNGKARTDFCNAEDFVIYPLSKEYTDNIYLKEFLITLVNKRGVNEVHLEKLLIDLL